MFLWWWWCENVSVAQQRWLLLPSMALQSKGKFPWRWPIKRASVKRITVKLSKFLRSSKIIWDHFTSMSDILCHICIHMSYLCCREPFAFGKVEHHYQQPEMFFRFIWRICEGRPPKLSELRGVRNSVFQQTGRTKQVTASPSHRNMDLPKISKDLQNLTRSLGFFPSMPFVLPGWSNHIGRSGVLTLHVCAAGHLHGNHQLIQA